MSHATSRKRLVQPSDLAPKHAEVLPISPPVSPPNAQLHRPALTTAWTDDKLAWIEKHGSPYLKRVIASGLTSM